MSQESAPNSSPVQPETAGHEVAGERAGAERESRAVDGPNSAGDKRAKRAALRSKFDEYLKASSKEDMNERMEEALAKLKQEPGAEEFNLMCRSRNGNKAGLIILNRLHGSSSKKASVPAPVPMPEPEAETEEIPVDVKGSAAAAVEVNDGDDADDDDVIEPPKPVRTRAARKTNPAPPKPRRPSKQTAASEALVMGLSNKVDELWRKIDHMKAKKKSKKLDKLARKSLKNLMEQEATLVAQPSATVSFYDRLDNAQPNLMNEAQFIYKGGF